MPNNDLDLGFLYRTMTTVGHRTPPRQTCSAPSILVCSVCLGDISRSDDEIVECDSCGISVHEGCYGICSDDAESVHSNTSSASTEPWFCDPCRACVYNPYCELCPNSGGIFKATDVGRWVHMVCALYIPGVAFSDVTRLTGLTLFELPYSRWGLKACILCEDDRLSRTGISVCCDAGMCKSYFHVTCAQREGLLSECHSAEEVDPFIAYCKLHADRSTVKSKRRNWLALQSTFRSTLKPITNQRIKLKLLKQRNKWNENRCEVEGKVWVPTQKIPRLLQTCPSVMKRLIRKAELLGLSPQTHIISHEVGDVRRKWHVPAAFSVEFISYYIDRNNRMSSMQKRSEELIVQNNQLKETEKTTRLAYDKCLQELEPIKEESDGLRTHIKNYFNILNQLSEQNIPLPKLLETIEANRREKLALNESKTRRSSVLEIVECGICHQTKDQHQLALCDSCHLYYHLYCLDPPLSRMPKKTRFGGWQCSECTEQQQDTVDSDNETSNQSAMDAPRRLREHVKGPNKFEPDAGYSPSPSSLLFTPKLGKRKIHSTKKKNKKLKANKSDDNQTSETRPKSSRRAVRSQRKQVENEEELCFQCNQMATIKERVQCDNCHNNYHLGCLDPPMKKTPKQRGYTCDQVMNHLKSSMARNASINSIIANNTNKKTFKSYIDLEVNPDANNADKESPTPPMTNTDEMWTTLDENGVTTDLGKTRRNSWLSLDTRDRKAMHRSTASMGSALSDTIDGVNYFYSHTKHRTGICGQLTLNSNGLLFLSYTSQHTEDKSHQTITSLSQFIPFYNEKSSKFEIDLLAIDQMKDTIDNNFIELTIFCQNFRRIRFQMKNCDQTKRIVDKLSRLAVNSILRKCSKLTKSLKDNYNYVLKADWNQFESHWKDCYKLRVTQTNENYQLCDSLPPSFVVPKVITDQMLIALISTQTRGQRVPVVSYLYPQNGNLLIRSSAFDNYEDLNSLLKDMVSPLRQINVESLLPTIAAVEQSYEKLKEVCFQSHLSEESSVCISKMGKWMTCVNTTLKAVAQIVQMITKEASVGLVEDLDRDWNCVIASLVQILVDPKRRTFSGFESLISKEWLYLSGLAYRKNSPRNVNHILFTLFLDCVSQLILQNPYDFEFSTFYLIYLFDCQYIQSSTPFIPNFRTASMKSTETDLKCAAIREGLAVNDLMLMKNPIYKRHKTIILKLNAHISKTEFWSALYLRWQSKPNLEHLSAFEIIYLNELQSRNQL
ncbi:unnamed protein product [Oppiella nova]|uniref:PHD finger protein 14 n=1 Tax=Oppiella nova TaxID=334625 RepID=A0A7R9LUF5_9ACAR|nr:unnamed protein product [Oppiella nova]CAG2166972.1 unnamed protein product [Oppiella nova]